VRQTTEMSKRELIEQALEKQKLNKARNLYRHFRTLSKLTDELQKRFGLLPCLDEIE